MLNLPRFSPETHTAEAVVAALGLETLDQEGGYFRRTAESETWVRRQRGDETLAEKRRAYSVIYSVITPTGFSALHRLRTDEIWCWHAGDRLESLRLYENGTGEWIGMSDQVTDAIRVHNIVPAGVWQGTRLESGGRWALASCIVAPEFRWEDFELGNPSELSRLYPDYSDAIASLSRPLPVEGEK